MSDKTKPQPSRLISFEEFLRDVLPNVNRAISVPETGDYFYCSALNLYCRNCRGFMNFETETSAIQKPPTDEMVLYKYFHFVCRNCKQEHYSYAVGLSKAGLRQGHYAVMKFGQNPPFGPHVPGRIRQLIGEDQELFNNALASESRGLGIGAFTYYRRIVENQWQRLLSEIVKVAEKTDPTPQI